MRNRIVLLAVVIGLLVGAAGVGLIVVTDDDGGTSVAADLPKLPAGASFERASAAADMMLAAPVEWRVKGDLPDLPDHATAYRLVAPKDAAVRRLDDALSGQPRMTGPSGEWAFSENGAGNCAPVPPDAAPDTPVACSSVSSGVATACAQDRPCDAPPPPAPPPDLPTEADARQLALGALDKAGIDTSGSVEVSGPVGGWNVATEPRVGGLRAFQVVTSLQIGSQGRIVGGYGRLLTTDEVGDYPLVSTAKGFERLKDQATPVPMRGGAEPAIAIAPGEPVPDNKPIVRTITGVTLGLSPSWSGTTGYLAPVFLFETDDGGVVPVPAVVDALLEQPGGGGTPEPVPVPGGPPQQVPPAPPSPGGSSGSGGTSTGGSQSCAGSASASNAGGDTNQPLTLEVCASPTNPKPGETVAFTMKASDPDAAIDAEGCQQPRAAYGDESDQSVSCMSICSRDSFPPEATTLGKTFTHAYAKPGVYKAVFTADSCAPKASHGQVELEITVRA